MRRELFFFGFLVLAPSYASEAFATCTSPTNVSNGQIANAPWALANIEATASCAGATASSVTTSKFQINNGADRFGNANPLTDEQLIAINATGSAPQITTIISGSGISISNQLDVISINSWLSAPRNSPKINQSPLSTLFFMTNMALSVSFSSKSSQ